MDCLPPALPEGRSNVRKYSIIYADPPWQYQQKGVEGTAEKIYPTMALEDLCKLPNALQLIQVWGFRYKNTAFLWLKQNKSGRGWYFGLGFWTRGNAEICLLAAKGHPKRKSKRIHQFIISPLREHSRKPDETREKIVELMGDLPRIELFVRQKTGGWDTWGNEIVCDICLSDYAESAGGDVDVG